MATFRKFKNAFKGNLTEDIWINIDHIVTVFESLNANTETNEMKSSVTLFSKDGMNWQIDEPINEVARKLSGEPVQDGMATHFQQRVSDAKKIDDLTKT